MTGLIRMAAIGTILLGAAVFSPTVSAAVLSLTTSWYANASGSALAGPGQTNSLTAVSPVNGYTYGEQVSDIAGNAFTAVPGYGFDDAYVIDLSTLASATSITATIDLPGTSSSNPLLQISGLQVRFFEYSPAAPNAPVLPVPLASGLPPGGSNLLPGWTTPSGSGWVSVFSDSSVDPGRYVLEVRGLATGSSGGTYAGLLQVGPPVPLPAALPLLASALSGLGLWGSTRKRKLSPA